MEQLSEDEKAKLYEVIDFQENAAHGIYPKSFVEKQLKFELHSLKITVKDEDKKDAEIVQLILSSVESEIRQRPSAENIYFSMSMASLNITGLKNKKNLCPVIIKTQTSMDQTDFGMEALEVDSHLLRIEFENNPPDDPNDLDNDKGN